MEKPLEHLVTDGGMTGIFRTIGCIGDSLSSGEHESTKEDGTKGFHDFYEYSWGQYMARMAGTKVLNFSCGGMTAQRYHSWAEEQAFWNPEKACQAYIVALGVNDINTGKPMGSVQDLCAEDWTKHSDTIAGWYGAILQRLRLLQPRCKLFLMTPPRMKRAPELAARYILLGQLVRDLAEAFPETYVLDFERYAPMYDDEFRHVYFLGGHMNAMGYLLTAKYVTSYLDYIIRHQSQEFKEVGFIGTTLHNVHAQD